MSFNRNSYFCWNLIIRPEMAAQNGDGSSVRGALPRERMGIGRVFKIRSASPHFHASQAIRARAASTHSRTFRSAGMLDIPRGDFNWMQSLRGPDYSIRAPISWKTLFSIINRTTGSPIRSFF